MTREIKMLEIIRENTTDGSILDETKRKLASKLGVHLFNEGLINYEKELYDAELGLYLVTVSITVKKPNEEIKEIEDND